MTPRIAGLLVASAVTAAACGGPRDPEGTLESVRGGVLQVGWSSAPGHCTAGPVRAEPRGPDADLVRRLAAALDAQVVWIHGPQDELFQALKRFDLDLVVCGVRKAGPWKKHLAFTKPYDGEHVLAAPPGENGWLAALDRLIAALARETAT